MAPEHRYIIAFLAASLKDGRTFTHVYDHDARREVAVGGIVRPGQVEVVEAATGARIAGEPKALYHYGSKSYLQLQMEGAGFSGYDYASKTHYRGLFQQGGVVHLFDHQSGRYHAFHVK